MEENKTNEKVMIETLEKTTKEVVSTIEVAGVRIATKVTLQKATIEEGEDIQVMTAEMVGVTEGEMNGVLAKMSGEEIEDVEGGVTAMIVDQIVRAKNREDKKLLPRKP